MRNQRYVLFKAVLIILLLSEFAVADVPLLVNYRGYIDVSDPGIGLSTGALTVELEFNLYDTSETEGATPLWTETRSIQLLDGNFAVMLGRVNPFSLDTFSGAQRYLSVSIDGEEVIDAQQLSSVPYAMQAGNVYSSPDGRVGIGTSSPTTHLDVRGAIKATGNVLIGSNVTAGGSISADSVTSNGIIQSASGGFVFPDGSTLNSASSNSLDSADGDPKQAVYVDNDGNVGIGTTGPAERLEVKGNIKASGAIAGFGVVPVGSVTAWHKAIVGASDPPDGWVECNGQVLDDPASPLHGQIIPDLNLAAGFVRGSTTSGTLLTDLVVGDHLHTAAAHSHYSPGHKHGGLTTTTSAIINPANITISGNTGGKSNTITMVWIIRVK